MSKQTSLFVRQSSGLVREASAIDAIIFNAVFSAPVGATLAFGIFYALGTSPGADLVTALLIAFIVNIPVCIMMSMMASAMPRTGGDYVWISRILHPAAAVFCNFSLNRRSLLGAFLRCACGWPNPGSLGCCDQKQWFNQCRQCCER